MVEANRPLLNRGSLGATPVFGESAINRILATLGVDLLPNFPEAAFARFLNDAAQMALDRSFSTKPASRQIQEFKASYKSLLARSHKLQRMGVAVPMPPDRWRDHAEKFIDDWENAARGRHGHALGDLQFCGSLIGLFHAATGLEPTVTTGENRKGGAGPLARFVSATLLEIRGFCEQHRFDAETVNEDRLQRFISTPDEDGSALRKQLKRGRDKTNWMVRARSYREQIGATEKS